MLCGDGSGQLPERQGLQGTVPAWLQQTAAPDGPSLGRPEPAGLPLGPGVLREEAGRGQELRLCPALPCPALAQDPMEDVADPDAVRRGVASAESGKAWKLGHRPDARRWRSERVTRANSAESKDPVKYDEEPVNENSKTALAEPENILTRSVKGSAGASPSLGRATVSAGGPVLSRCWRAWRRAGRGNPGGRRS